MLHVGEANRSDSKGLEVETPHVDGLLVQFWLPCRLQAFGGLGREAYQPQSDWKTSLTPWREGFGGSYVPAVTGATLQTMQTVSILILSGIFGVVVLMMSLAVMALFYRAAIGSQQERALVTSLTPNISNDMRWIAEDASCIQTRREVPPAGVVDHEWRSSPAFCSRG